MENANRPTSPEIIHLQNAIGAAQKVVKAQTLTAWETEVEAEEHGKARQPNPPPTSGGGQVLGGGR